MKTNRVILEHAQPSVAAIAEQQADGSSCVVVIDNQTRAFVSAAATSPELSGEHRFIILDCDTEGLEKSAVELSSFPFGRCADLLRENARAWDTAGLAAFLAALPDYEIESADVLDLTAVRTQLFGLRRLWRMLALIGQNDPKIPAISAFVAMTFASAVVVGRELVERLDFAALAAWLLGHGLAPFEKSLLRLPASQFGLAAQARTGSV